MSTLSTEQLRSRIEHLPRMSLAHLPTPLDEVPRFSQRLNGPRMWIKRDDCTGLYFGGNKTRHNEFLLAEALRRKADVLVWGAGVQSNNCRQTAAACNKLGLDCVLYLSRAAHNEDIQGNLLLDHLMGAKIHIVDEPLGPELAELLLVKSAELERAGRRPFVWDQATGRPLAAVSYALAMAEMLEQFQELSLNVAAIYASAGGATGAGLVLGKAALRWPGKVKLLCPIQWPWDIAADLAEVASAAAQLLELPVRIAAHDVDVRTNFIGPGYGQVTPEGREAMSLLAQTEGILLDPVYTAKAMAGLIHDVRRGLYKPDETVVFIHTGGTPAVFAYRDELLIPST